MTTKAKRILCLLLSMVMLLSLLPMAALADGGGTTFGEDWTDLNTYVGAHTTSSDEIYLNSGKYYLSDNLNIGSHWLQINDGTDVTIDLNGHVLQSNSQIMVIKVIACNLTVQDSAPATLNIVDGETINGGVIFASIYNSRCISTDSGSKTLTLKGGTIFSYGPVCIHFNIQTTFYADGGTVEKRVTGASSTIITRHDDATDYTTFNGDFLGVGTIEDKAKLTVNFVDSGTTVATQKVLKGQKLATPPAPSKDSLDLSFLGWYTAAGDEWSFDTAPVTAPMTLYAKWQHGSTWTKLSDAPKSGNVISLNTNGKYYLDADLAGFDNISIEADVTIDLNGHELNANLARAITIWKGCHLTLQDSGTGGKVVGASSTNLNVPVIELLSEKESGVVYPSSLTLKGGTICGTIKMECNNRVPCTLYADGGTVEGSVFGNNDAIITRHDDAADYTTFNGELGNVGTIEDKAKLTVNFVDGDDTVATQKVLKGQKLAKPTLDGKLLISCTKADGTPWDFNNGRVLEHTNGVVTLSSKWISVSGSQDGFTAKLGDVSADYFNTIADSRMFSTDYLSTFYLEYKDAEGAAPTTDTTFTISGVTVTAPSKPVYVIVERNSFFSQYSTYRAKLDSDGKLSFTMNGKDSDDFLAGCNVAITQSTLDVDIALTLPLPQKLTKNGDDKYEVNYSVNATGHIDSSYSCLDLNLYVNGNLNDRFFNNSAEFLNDLNTGKSGNLNAKLAYEALTSGQISAYAGLSLEKTDTYLNVDPLIISPTLRSNVSLVEFAESSEPDAEITDTYLVETGKSLGSNMPADPTKEGHTFVGWFYKDSSDTEVSFSSSTNVTESITVYPKFARATFAVIFDPKNDDSTMLVNAPTYEALGVNGLMPDDPKKAGYSFVGWFYINEDGNEAEFTDDFVVNSDMDVYAKWSIIVNYYTLTYVSNGGTEYAPERYTYGTVVTLDKVPVREGYDFTGWFADEALTEKIDSIRMNYFKTVYAGWDKAKVDYTLTYASNGGTEYAPETYAEGTVVALDKLPTREGYVFTGWFADETLKQAVTSVEMTSDKTVYAGWKGEYVPPELNSGDHIAYVKGYDDGTVKPMNNLTRAETAMMLYRLLTDEHRAEIAAVTNDFTDVSAKDWYNEAVSTMTKGGYITGYVDGTFCGGNNITRSEFIAILVRFIGVIDGAQCSYSDVPADHWAYDYIATATTAGWIVGSGDGKFNPDALITRAEAMTIINRVLDRGVDEDSTLPEFRLWPDSTPDDWFYFDVIEATNSHEYTGSRPSENWISIEK